MLTIKIDNQPAAFVPGQAIRGRVEWDVLSEKTEEIDIRMIWYTSGKGDRDFEIVENISLVDPGISGNSDFNFTAAARPHSFSGKLISLIWAIEVVIIPSLEAEQVEFVVSNSGTEIVLGGG